MGFSERLRKAMKAHNHDAVSLAVALRDYGVDVTPRTVETWAQGTHDPGTANAYRALVRALVINATWLIVGEGSMND